MTSKEFKSIFKEGICFQSSNEFIRLGQAISVTLTRHYPEIANEILATEYDFFYKDENLINFILKYVKEDKIDNA